MVIFLSVQEFVSLSPQKSLPWTKVWRPGPGWASTSWPGRSWSRHPWWERPRTHWSASIATCTKNRFCIHFSVHMYCLTWKASGAVGSTMTLGMDIVIWAHIWQPPGRIQGVQGLHAAEVTDLEHKPVLSTVYKCTLSCSPGSGARSGHSHSCYSPRCRACPVLSWQAPQQPRPHWTPQPWPRGEYLSRLLSEWDLINWEQEKVFRSTWWFDNFMKPKMLAFERHFGNFCPYLIVIFLRKNIDPCLGLCLLLLPLDPGGLVHSEPPLLLVPSPWLGGLHCCLNLLSLGHSFEEPGSRLLPQLSALSTDLAKPGRLLEKKIYETRN